LPSTDEKVAFLDTYLDKFADPDPFPPVYYSAEESVDMLQLQTDMVQYIERKASEWIMNGQIEAEWDAYLTEIERVGLPRWLSIKQAAYDRYIAG
jgi:putative aldouronate transport system substrate-binding protein